MRRNHFHGRFMDRRFCAPHYVEVRPCAAPLAVACNDECGILRSTIPYLAQIEQVGLYRQPVKASGTQSKVAPWCQALWTKSKENLLDDR